VEAAIKAFGEINGSARIDSVQFPNFQENHANDCFSDINLYVRTRSEGPLSAQSCRFILESISGNFEYYTGVQSDFRRHTCA